MAKGAVKIHFLQQVNDTLSSDEKWRVIRERLSAKANFFSQRCVGFVKLGRVVLKWYEFHLQNVINHLE